MGLAVLVKAPEANVTEEELIDYCKGKLADFERPRKVVFIDQLPHTEPFKGVSVPLPIFLTNRHLDFSFMGILLLPV